MNFDQWNGCTNKIYFQDMEQLQNLTKYDMPEVSEMITSYFSGSTEKQNCRPGKQSKKSKSSWANSMWISAVRYRIPASGPAIFSVYIKMLLFNILLHFSITIACNLNFCSNPTAIFLFSFFSYWGYAVAYLRVIHFRIIYTFFVIKARRRCSFKQ